jgi:hypothetical protein
MSSTPYILLYLVIIFVKYSQLFIIIKYSLYKMSHTSKFSLISWAAFNLLSSAKQNIW